MRKLIPFSLLLWLLTGQAWGQTCTNTIATFPYFQNFDSGAGGWTSGNLPGAVGTSSWGLGAPTGTVINCAASLPNAWVTSLSGTYNNEESSYVLSPCFNFASLTAPIFIAKIFWDCEYSWDGAVLQSSIDNGLTWQNVGSLNDPNNWFNYSNILSNPGGQAVGWTGTNTLGGSGSGGWVIAKHALTGLAGQANVRLRFAFSADASLAFEGFAFDDVAIIETPTVDIELTTFTAPHSGCSLSAAENVCVTLINKGIAAQTNIPVSYRIGNNTPVTETITTTLAPGATYTYCFNQKANLTTPGTYTITATNLLTNDGDPSNDLTSTTIISVPVISSFPYNQNFENGAGGWRVGGTNASWAIGTPAKQIIQGAASGSNAWVTSLTGIHNINENSYVMSPCFNFSGFTSGDPDFEMKVWWASEAGEDGAVLQSSIDGGATWQTVGSMGQPNNWYNSGTITGNPGGQTQGWTGGAGWNTSPPGSNGWVKVKHKLTGLAGQPAVILRVAFGSNPWTNYDGFAFDEVRIGDNTNNLSIIAFTPLANLCGFGTNEPVEVLIENLGNVAVSNYNLQFRVDGGAWFPNVPATGNPLLPDTPTNFTFTQGADLSAAGPHSIEVRIMNNGGTDPQMANNSLIYNVTNAIFNTSPVTLDFETPPTSVSAARTLTRSKSGIAEIAGTGISGSKGLIMDGIDDPTWVVPVGMINPWTNNLEKFSALYICLGPTNLGPDSLVLQLDLKQFYKFSHYNTNFRVTVNGTQASQTFNPPFGGYDSLGAQWKKIKVDLTPFISSNGIQIGLESNVSEQYDNGNGTANLIDNVEVQRITVSGYQEKLPDNQLLIFPNPSAGLFNLKVPVSTRNYSVEVTDLTGKLIKKQLIRNNSGLEQLNLAGTAKGIYLLKIASEGNIFTRKLVIQ